MPEYQIVPDGWDGPSIPISGPVKIGRDPSNEIRLPFARVSRFHCEVKPNEETRAELFPIIIQDFNSTNGVWVNNRRISSRLPLRVGDLFAVGDREHPFRISEMDSPAIEPVDRATALARRIFEVFRQENVVEALDHGAPVTLNIEAIPPDPVPVVTVTLGSRSTPEADS